MESFFASLKTEHVHPVRFRTREEARAAVFEYIEIFYNRRSSGRPVRAGHQRGGEPLGHVAARAGALGQQDHVDARDQLLADVEVPKGAAAQVDGAAGARHARLRRAERGAPDGDRTTGG